MTAQSERPDLPQGWDSSNVMSIQSGIDWLTMTCKPDWEGRQEWISRCVDVLLDIKEDGNELKRGGIQGYRGHILANNFVGHSEQGTLVQFTGRYSDVAWPHVGGDAIHIARIDTQTTVTYREMPIGVEELAYASAIAAAGNVSYGKRRTVSRFSDSSGGSTIYIGAPTSEARGRVYNKERQSKDPVYANSWRYEVVFRNDRATRWGAIIRASGCNYRPLVARVVSDWFTARGVDCTHWCAEAPEARPPAKTRATDFESKLLWLERQVRPAIKDLREQGHLGYVLGALGLPGVRTEIDITDEP